jgi:hypothetical protein
MSRATPATCEALTSTAARNRPSVLMISGWNAIAGIEVETLAAPSVLEAGTAAPCTG